jgi:hypothetical protein
MTVTGVAYRHAGDKVKIVLPFTAIEKRTLCPFNLKKKW